MIEGVDIAANAGEDKGAERETRLHPCRKRTWCVSGDGHGGPCLEQPRTKLPPTDFGPGRKR